MEPFPEEEELRHLFGVEPALLDPGAAWRDNALSFDVVRGDDRVECLIEPVYRTLTVRWTRDGRELVYLDLTGVRGMTADQYRGRDSLLVTFDGQPGLRPLRIQIRPAVHVTWGTRDDAEQRAESEGHYQLGL
jgi:hypothetical protein